ncbi:hypothetical protein BDF20DRAFT_839664 [Mycotypha africana]|uniref:uncharacterized protein n=1 Tax=Mycotypha africana TaxID=64632 RepID=UPI00230028D7|nr:uncharacterized protein BDF20DRAFT_839664 [Mycotypha africana]KAI8968573.1 hypothetical protein BDF20DRAFT_839664 [Mycotypha africana]
MALRTLNENYSLAWLEMSTITLFTLMGSLFTLLSFIKNHTERSRFRLETVCDSINTASEQIANTPYILLQTSLAAVVTAKENIHRNLSTAILVINNVIVWLIRMYKSTYRCLLELAVRSVLSLVTQIAGPVQTVAQGVTSILNLGNNGGDSSTATLNWTGSLTGLQRKIDDWFKNDDDLIRGWIDTPFHALQTQLNHTFSSWQPPNTTGVTTIQQQNGVAAHSLQLIPCQPQPLLNALNNAESQLIQLIQIFIGVLFAIFLICVLVNLLFIRFRHDRVTQARRLFLLRHHYNSCNTNNSADGDLNNHSRTCRFENDEQDHVDKLLWTMSTKLSYHKRKNVLHQLLCFMVHPIILYCLVVGLSGVILIHCLASVIETKAAQVSQDMVQHTEAWITNTTTDYVLFSQTQIADINQWLDNTEMSLNDQAFGVIKSSAMAMNDSLTAVVHHIHGFIETALGGTMLESPAKELTQCLLLTKIDNLQQGLTWLAGHTYIHLTRVDNANYITRFQSKLQTSISDHINFLVSDNGPSFLTDQLNSMHFN